MLASDDIHLDWCFSTNSLWSTRYFKILPNVGRVKSSVDDLTMERGTVSMRVAFVRYDLLRFSLCSGICAKCARKKQFFFFHHGAFLSPSFLKLSSFHVTPQTGVCDWQPLIADLYGCRVYRTSTLFLCPASTFFRKKNIRVLLEDTTYFTQQPTYII